MVAKYTRLLEQRITNNKTGEIWTIQDVPNTWRNKTRNKVIDDGYFFDEDGTARPVE